MIKLRLVLIFVCGVVMGSAINTWYLFFMSFINPESSITFTTNQYHEQNVEFILFGLFIMGCIWLWYKRKAVKRYLTAKMKEQL